MMILLSGISFIKPGHAKVPDENKEHENRMMRAKGTKRRMMGMKEVDENRN